MASPCLRGSFVILFSILILCHAKFGCAAAAHRRYKKPKFCEDSELDSPMTFLWTIKKEPPAFFFGTIHVPYTRVWDYIPDNTKRAFELSEKVFFELDLTNPFTISALTNCQMLPEGKSLSDILPLDIYNRLKSHLEYVKVMMPSWLTADQRGRGLYADYLFNAITGNWERKRPIWIMLMVNSLTENDIKSRGVPVLDLYLAQEAEKMNKNTGAVERVEEQCIPLNKLNFSQVLFALNQTLNQQEKLRLGDESSRVPYTTDDLIKHYNCGNLNSVIFSRDTAQVPNMVNASKLPPVELDRAKVIDDYFRSELIYKRNRRMAHRVNQLLRSYPDQAFFFAFGAGHFLGNHTILDVLREQGYHIEHVPATQKIKLPRKWRRRKMQSTYQDFSMLTGSSITNPYKPVRPQVSYIEPNKQGRRRVSKKLYQQSRYNSSPAISSSKQSKSKKRNFNDLWVRIEDFSTTPLTPTKTLPHMTRRSDDTVMQYSLRLWYSREQNSAILSTKSVDGVIVISLSISLYIYLINLCTKVFFFDTN